MANNVFANLRANLNLNLSNFTTGLNSASSQLSSFAKRFNTSIASSTKDTRRFGLEFKDVGRIVQGITISRAFYGTLQTIQSATNAVWEFSKQLESANVAYKALFNDTALATEFVNVLKDFAAVTPFSFTEAEKAARRLLAYGVEYKNVMFVMQGVLSAASAQGNADSIEPISRALGQIYTRGKLVEQEMRQLAEAGIPAYQILREELQLTSDQIANIGAQSIPASVAINALVTGINKRYGNIVGDMARTTDGLINKIKDNALLLSSGVLEPVIERIRVGLRSVGDTLDDLRESFNMGGVGSVFENLIPPELQSTFRAFAANLMNFGRVMKVVFSDVVDVLRMLGVAFMQAANIIIPVIGTFVSFFGTLARLVLQSTSAIDILSKILIAGAAAWLIYRAAALGALVLNALSTVINGLSKAIAFLSAVIAANPLLFFLGAVAAALVGLSISGSAASGAIQDLFGALTALNGTDPNTLFLPDLQDRTADLNKFNNALDQTSDSIDELDNKANGSSSKKRNSLLPFDEVFRLNEPGSEGAGGGTGPFSDWEIPDLSDFNQGISDIVPSLGGVSAGVNQIAEAAKKLWDVLAQSPLGRMVGAIRDFVGSLFKGDWPGVVQAVVDFGTAFKDLLWGMFQNVFNLNDSQELPVSLGAAIGLLLGGLNYGPGGALIGAGIGALAESLVSALVNGLATRFGKSEADIQNSSIGQTIGLVLGGVFGAVFGGPGGAAIGAGIGSLLGAVVGLFWTQIAAYFQQDPGAGVSMAIGGGLGAVIGAALGGPGGAIIGAGIGTLVTGVSTLLFSMLADALGKDGEDKANSSFGRTLGTVIGGIFGLLLGGPGGAAIGAGIGNLIGGILGLFFNDLVVGFQEHPIEYTGAAIGAVLGGMILGPIGIAVGAAAGQLAGKFITIWTETIWPAFKNWVVDTVAAFNEWKDKIIDILGGWAITAFAKVQDWDTNMRLLFGDWWVAISDGFQGWMSNVVDIFSAWYTNTMLPIQNFVSDAWSSFSGWFMESTQGFRDFTSSIGEMIENWARGVWDSITNWFNKAIDKIKEFLGIKDEADEAAEREPSRPTGGSKQPTNVPDNIVYRGHALGGIFNREHIARFAEDNRAEAIIPLQNAQAMQPFVDAISDGLTQSLAPMLATVGGNSETLPPLYVGALIADDRGIRELYRKFNVISAQEAARKNLNNPDAGYQR